MRGDVNHLPILIVDGFFDVESRGAFQAYQELRDDGAHLMVIGAHDGVPAGTEGDREAEGRAWFDHYIRGITNGIEQQPKVKLWLADGDREDEKPNVTVDGVKTGLKRVDQARRPVSGPHIGHRAIHQAILPCRSGAGLGTGGGR